MLIAIILTVTLFLHIRKPIIKIVTAISIAIILLCCSFIFLLAYDDPKYFTFKSQGNETILIAEEHAWLLAGWSRLYVRHDFMFVRDLKIRIGTDDGYRPFSNEDYKLTWIDKNTVSLSYGFGYSNIVKTEIIKVR